MFPSQIARVLVLVLALSTAVPGSLSPGSALASAGQEASSSPPAYEPVTPARLLDTRRTQHGAGPFRSRETRQLRVVDVAAVPPDASAVVLNVTAIATTRHGYVTVWPSGGRRPSTSNLNPVAGRATANLVVSGVGDDGQVSIFNKDGETEIIADVVGYYPSAHEHASFFPTPPVRAVDSRIGMGADGPLQPGETVAVPMAGTHGIPEDAVAVAVNLTAVHPTRSTYLTVFPDGSGRPRASNLNAAPGDVVANMTLVGLGPNGAFSVFNASGGTDVVVDVVGHFTAGDGESRYHGIRPRRLLDTRPVHGGAGAFGSGEYRRLEVARLGDLPAGATTAVLNVTAVSPARETYLAVYPTGVPRPVASNVNAVAGQVVANLVVSGLGTEGGVVVFNKNGPADVIVDLVGYVTGPSDAGAPGENRPLFAADSPDPEILLIGGGRYLLYSTNASTPEGFLNVPVRRWDRENGWQLLGDALPRLPSWTAAGYTWAPGVIRVDGGWALYFVAPYRDTGRQCIGVAFATDPSGPFESPAAEPLVCELGRGGSIDPSPFRNADGQRWLLWKCDNNAIGEPATLWSQALSPDGAALIGGRHLLLTAGDGWERGVAENPEMVRRNGVIHLLYSGGPWDTEEYAIGHAVCDGAAGPCVRSSSEPVLRTDADVTGPGGASITTFDGWSQLVFHGWTPEAGYGDGRMRAPYATGVFFERDRLDLVRSAPQLGAQPG